MILHNFWLTVTFWTKVSCQYTCHEFRCCIECRYKRELTVSCIKKHYLYYLYISIYLSYQCWNKHKVPCHISTIDLHFVYEKKRSQYHGRRITKIKPITDNSVFGRKKDQFPIQTDIQNLYMQLFFFFFFFFCIICQQILTYYYVRVCVSSTF